MATGIRLKVKRSEGGVEGLKERLKPGAISVGILEGTGNHPESPDLTIAEVFARNEFGVPEENIPERPVLRVVFRDSRSRYRNLFRTLLKKLAKGDLQIVQARGILGEAAQADVQKYIRDLKEPPNSPATIAAKGSSNPLIDSGAMRRSVRWGPASVRLLRLRIGRS